MFHERREGGTGSARDAKVSGKEEQKPPSYLFLLPAPSPLSWSLEQANPVPAEGQITILLFLNGHEGFAIISEPRHFVDDSVYAWYGNG